MALAEGVLTLYDTSQSQAETSKATSKDTKDPPPAAGATGTGDSSSGSSDAQDDPGSRTAGDGAEHSTGEKPASNSASAQQAAQDATRRASEAAAQAQERIASAAKWSAETMRAVADEMFKGRAGASSAASGDSQAGGEGGSAAPGAGSAKASSSASGAAGAASMASGLFERAKRVAAGLGGARKGAGGAGGAGGEGAQQDIVSRLRTEVAEAVLPVARYPSVMKRRTDVEAVEIRVGEGPSDLIVTETPRSWVDRLAERLGKGPLVDRINKLRASETAQRVSESYQDVKEKLENSDSDVLNRIQEARQRLAEESEAAVAYRELRMRHPHFDMPTFLRSIKQEVPVVIKAYLEGSEAVLAEYCSDSMLERLVGIHKVMQAEGQLSDSTILEYSDVDMVDMKMLDDDPVIILHFSCQQINCVRDRYGSVVSGSPGDVNRVYYYWAVQQDGHGLVTKEGEYIPPRWKLTEMLLRGMHQLL